MADLTTDFLGIKSPNPFWLASAPPTDKEYNVVRAFKAGWGGVVWKTLGEEGPPIVNVNGPRYGAIWGADRRLLGLNNIELITDRPLEVNLREIKQVKRDWPDRAMIVSIMVPCEEAAWKAILPLVEETGADGIELNFGCPHGMSERGMGSAVGQVPDYIEMVTRWCKQNTRMPVIVKLTPNITDIRYPARAAKKGGADAVSLINTISSITERQSRHVQPRALDRRQGLPRRLLRPGGEAHRAQHGGRDRARPGDARPADQRHRRRHDLARRRRIPGTRRGHGAGLHGGDDLRLQDRGGDEIGPQPVSRRTGHGHCPIWSGARCPM
jgi:dihydroorotate dehydrogenase